MKKFLPLFILICSPAFAGMQMKEQSNSISAEMDGKVLWTYHHDPAEGKPYFHPLESTAGTRFTDLRPEDHPWHRGVWFSWKFINGVNYWEEDRTTGKSTGETRIVGIKRGVEENKATRIELNIEYAPAGTEKSVMQESRSVVIAPPDESGAYFIDWSSRFQALENDVVLDRTPLPHEPNGKNWGGYTGWSVRMNKDMKGGSFLNRNGKVDADREAACWMLFRSPNGGSLLFMDHPDNLNYPSKWYLAPGMPYFSPAVIHDAPLTLKAGESLTLRYRLIVLPETGTKEQAEAYWKEWQKTKVVILTGSNNHAWQKTTPALKAVLEQSGTFDVDIETDPEKLTPAFLSSYDVLLSNWNGFGKNKPAPWSDELKKAYVDFVRNGGGHVVVHAGSSSFDDWDDYHAICCATWKDGTGHVKPHEFEVRISDANHPITEGLENFKATDELWFKPFVHPDADVIAESFSKTTGNWEPTALTGQFGKGRCFTLLLGHNEAFIKQSGFKTLLIAGVEWAAKAFNN